MNKLLAGLSEHHIVAGMGRVGSEVARAFAAEGVPVHRHRQLPGLRPARDRAGLAGARRPTRPRRRRCEPRASIALRASSRRSTATPRTCSSRSRRARSTRSCSSSPAPPSSNAEDKLRRAGADRVITPSVIGGARMASMVLHPYVSQYVDLFDKAGGEMRLEEVELAESSPLVGKTLQRGAHHRAHGRVRAGDALARTDALPPLPPLIRCCRRAPAWSSWAPSASSSKLAASLDGTAVERCRTPFERTPRGPRSLHPRHPRLPEAGHPVQGHHAAARRRGRVQARPSTAFVDRVRRRGRHEGARRGGARVHPRRGARVRARRRLRARPQARASCRGTRRRPSTPSSTAPTASRSTRTPSGPDDVVLIVDDVLATGGTAHAKAELVEEQGRDGRGLRVPARARRAQGPREARRPPHRHPHPHQRLDRPRTSARRASHAYPPLRARQVRADDYGMLEAGHSVRCAPDRAGRL